MAVSNQPRSGKGGRVEQDGTIIKLKQWEVDDHAESQDSTNFESDGHQEEESGIDGCDVTFSGDWDAGQNPFDSPLSWFSGAFLDNVKLFINVDDDTYYLFPSFQLVTVRIGTPVRGLVSVAVTGKSDYVFTRPTG